MAFRFSLETVLRVRRSQEEQERLRLQTLFGQRSALQARQEALEKMQAVLNAHGVPRSVAVGLPAAELHFVNARTKACEVEAQELVRAMGMLEQQILQQTAVFVEKSRARKTLENLRDGQLNSYEVAANRKIQTQMDETALLTRTRRTHVDEDKLCQDSAPGIQAT